LTDGVAASHCHWEAGSSLDADRPLLLCRNTMAYVKVHSEPPHRMLGVAKLGVMCVLVVGCVFGNVDRGCLLVVT
jgi:hypothetical protein